MTKLKKGSRIGPFPYQIIKPLNSQGGMSDVYLATEAVHGDLDSGSRVVLKIARVHKNHHEFYENTIDNEAERLRKLHHRGVVHILPISTDSRMPNQTYAARTSLNGAPWFLVLEHLQGGSVDELLQKQARLPLALAFTIVLEIAKTLQFLHEQEQVHLDIKPENILLRRSLATGAPVEPVLIDFGVARDIGQEGLEARTLPYAPPERVEVYKENRPPETIAKPHPSMDLYSLGVVFYQMLTGRRPFIGRSNKKLSSAILESKVTPPSKFVSSLPPEVDELALALLHKEPAQRPTARDLVQQLEQWHHKKELAAKLQLHLEQFNQKRQPSSLWRNFAFGVVILALLVGFMLAVQPFVQWSGQPIPTPTTVVMAAVQPTSTSAPTLRIPTATPTPTSTPTAIPTREATSTLVLFTIPTRTATRVITPTASTTVNSTLLRRSIKTPTATTKTTAPTPRAKSTVMMLPTKTATAIPAPTNTPPPAPKVTNSLPIAPATPPPVNGEPPIANGGPTRLTAFGPDSGITGDGSLTFSWSADTPLAAGQVFELVFWRDGQSYNDGRAWNEASTANTASLKVSVQPAGSYYWGVWLAHQQPYQRIRYLGGGNHLVVKDANDNNSSSNNEASGGGK